MLNLSRRRARDLRAAAAAQRGIAPIAILRHR
jgi:hypothetical protein